MVLDNQNQDLSKAQTNCMSFKTAAGIFKKLQNQALIETAKALVQKEREVTLQVLDCLREIEARQLHLARGYSSLHEFAVKELGYSDGSAFRRIQAMRLTRDLPEVKRSIQEGKLSLSTASQAQRFFYSQKITKTGDKKVLIQKIENKSTREAESFFAGLAPECIRPEKERMITETHTEVRIVIDQNLRTKLEKVKNLISHKHPNPSYAELLSFLSDLALEKLDPEIKHQKSENSKKAKEHTSFAEKGEQKQIPDEGIIKASAGKLNQTKIGPAQTRQALLRTSTQIDAKTRKHSRYIPELLRSTQIENKMRKRSRYIPELLRRKIWVRDQGECQFVDPLTKRKCRSQKYLQLEHKRPFAAGGAHSDNNLTLLCATHNLFQAYQFYGNQNIEKHLAKYYATKSEKD